MRAISYQSPAYLSRSTSETVANFGKLEEAEEHAVTPRINKISDNFLIVKHLSILMFFTLYTKTDQVL